MCSIPAFPNIRGANPGGFSLLGINYFVLERNLSKGLALSLNPVAKDPLDIFSKPAASTQS